MIYDPSRLAGIVTREDTIVFVGSGVSAWSGLPTWRGLLEKLAELLPSIGRSADLVQRELANNDLLLAASYGFDQLTPRERCDFLRNSLHPSSAAPSSLHRALANLGSHCFITTNYDGLLEQALRETRPDEVFDVVTPLQLLEISSIVQARAKGFVFKPHGDLSSCDSIVLTREDYRRLHGDKRNVLEALQTLLVSRPIIFVGYSLKDPDFLLVQDLMATTFGAGPSDHYAVMPDVVSEEVEYWRRNYGIHLISYPTRQAGSGRERHSALLKLIEDIRPWANHDPGSGSKSSQVLALARHGRRLQSSIPTVDSIMPLKLIQDYTQPANRHKGLLRLGRDARVFLANNKDKLVLEGPPGAGKTFLLEQTVRDLGYELEQACLADQLPDLKDLRVPVIIYLRDYHGDIGAMLAQALPLDINLEDLLKEGVGAFFIDGFNESPVAGSETSDLMSDLITFIGRAGKCGVVVTTRFGDELANLGLPVVLLDEISPEYVRQELTQAGISPDDIDPVTLGFLNRPFFHKAWKDGSLSLSHVHTVHDVYTQLIQKMEAEAQSHFHVPIAFGEIFERIAYSMIDSGQLSMSAAEVHTNLRGSLDSSLEVRNFINFMISTGILIPTSTRRIAFFHHSVAEYFAAQYLAKMILADKAALQHCMGRHDWDQALLLTLGFLPNHEASAAFEEILRIDHAMALRALNYVEEDRSRWAEVALESLTSLASNEDRGRVVNYALSQLKLTESNTPMLLRLAEFDTSLGGTAAGLLWSIGDGNKEWILDLLVDTRRDYNFVSSIARVIAKKVDLPYALALIDRLSHLSVDDDVATGLMRGDEIYEYLGLISAVGDVLESVSSDSLINCAQKNPAILVERVVCEALRNFRTPEALEFVQECIIKGHDHAIVSLYFQLRFGRPEESELPLPQGDLLNALLSAMREGREEDWAFGCIALLAAARPEFRSKVAMTMRQEGGLMSALLAYAAGESDLFFEILEQEIQNSAAWADAYSAHALRQVEVSWVGRETLFMEILRKKDRALASSLFDSASQDAAIGDDWEIECTISDLDWWIAWLEEMKSDYVFCSRLGSFLANGTDQATRESIIARFNRAKAERRILEQYVLTSMAGLSLDMFEPDAVDWLVGQLNARHYYFWQTPLIGKIATESFVQERLLPLLLEYPPEPLRRNLLLTLRQAGGLHRRRYVGDGDEVLG